MGMHVRKLFKHGGSYAVDIPMPFVKMGDTDEIIIESANDELILRHKTELDTIEAEPQFAHFVKTLATDALAHPEKLKGTNDVWGKEWDTLLEGVRDSDE